VITKPGRYRVVAAGVRSRPSVVDRHARSRLIRRLLRLFAVNSDGNEPNPVFAPAHLNDAIVKGGPLDGQRIDLTGGWRDAGDNLKIALPTRPEVLGWPAVRPASDQLQVRHRQGKVRRQASDRIGAGLEAAREVHLPRHREGQPLPAGRL